MFEKTDHYVILNGWVCYADDDFCNCPQPHDLHDYRCGIRPMFHADEAVGLINEENFLGSMTVATKYLEILLDFVLGKDWTPEVSESYDMLRRTIELKRELVKDRLAKRND